MHTPLVRPPRRRFWPALLSIVGSFQSSIWAANFDLSAQFSATSNPSGVWTYGWKSTIGGSLTPLAYFTVNSSDNGVPIDTWQLNASGYPSVYHNSTTGTATSDGGQGVYPPGTTWFFAGYNNSPQNFGAIRFTVPTGGGGVYALSTTVHSYLNGSSSGETDFHVVWNGDEIFGQFLPTNGGTAFGGTIALADGDTIDFLSGRGADSNLYGAGLKINAVLALTNGPATITNSIPPPPPAGVYDLSAQFGTNSNPNGVWTYGWKSAIGGSFSNLTFFALNSSSDGVPVETWQFDAAGYPAVYHNGTTATATSDGGQGVYPPGTTWFFAGYNNTPQNFGAIRFTVPTGGGGVYALSTAVHSYLSGPSSGETDFHVVWNGNEIFSQFLPTNGGTAFGGTIALADGDTIDFLSGRGADTNLAGAGLKINAVLALTNGPATITNSILPPPTPGVYDLSAQFGTNSNPNGAWTYGWKSTIGGSLSNLTYFALNTFSDGVPVETWQFNAAGYPSVYHNGTTNTATSDGGQGVYPPGTTFFFAGNNNTPQNFGAIRFTVPAGGGGVYALSTAVHSYLNGPSSGETDFHVVWNGTEIFGQFLPTNGGTAYGGTIALADGDTIDFLSGRGADSNLYGAGLKINAVLALTNGPATITNSIPPPPPAGVYDLSAQFGTNSNPNGAWSYGWESTIGGSFTVLTNFTVSPSQNGVPLEEWYFDPAGPPVVYHNGATSTATSDNGAGSFPPGTTFFYAGYDNTPQNFGAIRFTVPAGAGGVYALATAVQSYLDGTNSGETDFHVVWNGTQIFGQFLASDAGTNFGGTLALAAGDTIDFLVGRGADSNLYGAGLKINAVLALTNGPATITTNIPPPPPAGVYDLSAQFGTNSNPNGVWTYGWKSAIGGSLSNLTFFALNSSSDGVPLETWQYDAAGYPAVYHNGTASTATSDAGQGVYPPGTTWFFAGYNNTPQNFGAIRFTVPTGGGGVYALSTAVQSYLNGPSSGETDFHVVWNGTEIFGQFLPTNGGTAFGGSIALTDGDTIDFLSGRGADTNLSGAGLKINAVLTLTNGPATITNTIPPPPPAGVYDLSAQFGTNSNPSGVWTYGWKSTVGGSLSNLTFYTLNSSSDGVPLETWQFDAAGYPAVYHNGTAGTATSDGGQGNYPPGTTYFFAGYNNTPQNFGAIRFTVPTGGGGVYALSTAVHSYLNGPSSGETDFHVVWNGTEIFGQFLPTNGGTAFGGAIALADGDTIDFLSGRGADSNLAGAGLKINAVLTLTNGPATITTNLPPPPPAGVYDLSVQFGTNSNPNGVWTYGWKSTVGGSLSNLTFFALNSSSDGVPLETWQYDAAGYPAVYHNGTTNTATSDGGQGVYPPGTTWFFAGYNNTPQNFGAIRFTVPTGGGGVYALSTAVQSYLNGPSSGETDFHVVWNGNEIFSQFLSTNGGTSFGGTIALADGDTIDFLSGRGADTNLAGAGLKINAVLALTNGPATITNTIPPPPPARVYDLSAQFGTNSNPNGVWSYGWKSTIGGSLSNLTFFAVNSSLDGVPLETWQFDAAGYPAVYHNGTTSTATSDGGQGVYPPGTTWFFAGYNDTAQNFGAIRFTVPTGAGGVYALASAVQSYLDGPSSGETDFHVVWNGTEIFGQFLPTNGGTAFGGTMALSDGDTIDFLSGRGADANLSGAGLKINAVLALTNGPVTITTNLLPPPPAGVPAGVYDLSAQFGTNSNPNGVWSYGWKSTVAGSFTLDDTLLLSQAQNGTPLVAWLGDSSVVYFNPSSVPVVANTGESSYPPGAVWVQAGSPGQPDYFGAIRFTVPAGGGGNYSLSAAVSPSIVGTNAGAYEFHVAQDGSELFGQFLTNTQSAAYTNVLTLAAGDTVDLLVGRGSNATALGSVAFVQASISLLSQPSTTNGQPLEITSPLPDGTIGGFYSAQLGAVGGQAPYFWTLAPGSAALPPGLSLSTNGLLSGIPAALGETTFIVQVTDANTNAAEVFTITVVNPPSLSATGRSGGGDFQFVLGGGLSQNYTVQFTTNLAPGSWTTLFVTNNPGLSSLPLAVPFGAGATGFYRVMVGP